MRSGVPFDQAFGITDACPVRLSRVERTALSVIFSEFEGQKFNTETMRFEKN